MKKPSIVHASETALWGIEADFPIALCTSGAQLTIFCTRAGMPAQQAWRNSLVQNTFCSESHSFNQSINQSINTVSSSKPNQTKPNGSTPTRSPTFVSLPLVQEMSCSGLQSNDVDVGIRVLCCAVQCERFVCDTEYSYFLIQMDGYSNERKSTLATITFEFNLPW